MFMSLGRLLFNKKRWLNYIVVFQLALALTIANILIGNYNKTYQAYNFTYNYDNTVSFFTPIRIEGNPEIMVDYNLLKEEGTTIEFLPKIIEGKSVKILSYGNKTAEGLRHQLTQGEWASCEASNGVIDCVVIGEGYEIGDVFLEKVGAKTFSFLVKGRLESGAMVISPSRSSSVMRANLLFCEYDVSDNGPAIICCSEDIAKEAGTYGNGLVFGASSDVREHLSNTGNITSMQQIRNNSDEELSLLIKSYLPLAICFGMMGFVGAVCMACMNLLANKKVFDVYFIVGMRRGDAFWLNLCYMCWMLFGVAIVTLTLFIVCNLLGITDKKSYLSHFNNYFFSIVYLLTATLGTAFASLLVLKPSDISKT